MEQISKDWWALQGNKKKGVADLRKALQSSKSADEMLRIFKKIEVKLQENQLGWDCWMLTNQLFTEDKDPLKILSFGKRALNNSLHDQTNAVLGSKRSSLIIACILHWLGYACFQLNRFNESLGYLNWADRNLAKLLDNYCDKNVVLEELHNTHLTLSRLKKAMGRRDEAVFHLKRVLEVDEKRMKRGSIDIGRANKDVSDAYKDVGNYKEALSFCLKALEIYKEHLADDSNEVTWLRVSLRDIYYLLGELDKAFEQSRLCLTGLKSMGNTSLMLEAEAKGGFILVQLGRYEEAIEALKPVISHNETAGNRWVRALAFMGMARAFCRLEKLDNARKYIKSAVRILEKKGFTPDEAAFEFMEMAKLYEEMKEYEAAISLVQKALNIPELSQNDLESCSFRLFSLAFLSGTVEKTLPSLVEVVQRLKENVGSEHRLVGYGYLKLGLVYMELGRPGIAVEPLVRAKDLLDASLGPYHLDSLFASQTLSVAYEGIESYGGLAIEIQAKVVEGFKGLGLSEQDRANEAVQFLKRMKGGGEVAESDARALCQSKDGEDLSTKDTKCGVSVSNGNLVIA